MQFSTENLTVIGISLIGITALLVGQDGVLVGTIIGGLINFGKSKRGEKDE